jgi:hypothetical protein
MLEQVAPQQVGPIREALSQLQLAFVRIGGATEPGTAPGPAGPEGEPPPPGPQAGPQTPGDKPPPGQKPPKPGEAGPAQRSGRLWIPGQ